MFVSQLYTGSISGFLDFTLKEEGSVRNLRR